QGGGFGSFSKHYGSAAGSLLEAEVVTADGQTRIANACTNPDLFWALKGGGGGTFGVVSRMTARLHQLPEFFGPSNFKIKAASDEAYRRLIREFVGFYAEHLFNDHLGGQARFGPDNTVEISMISHGVSAEQARGAWQPFLDWVEASSHDYSFEGNTAIGAVPAQHFWDPEWWKGHWPEIGLPRNGSFLRAAVDDLLELIPWQPALAFDQRPGQQRHAWWKGITGECGWFIWGYESLWLPQSLLASDAQQHLSDALYAASRRFGFALHFNKGLGGAPP